MAAALCTSGIGGVVFRPHFRRFSVSSVRFKVQPKNVKGKSKCAQDWLTRQLNDPYVKQSRYDHYRARSAYKLIEIDERYGILKPGYTVVECGAAPGSWTQVVVRKTNSDGKDYNQPKGAVVAVDLIPLDPIPGATLLPEADVQRPETLARILECLHGRRADSVLSDMAPSASGVKHLDHDNIVALAYASLIVALQTLSVGGSFLCKIWDGSRGPQLARDIEKFFHYVHYVKPKASRGDSAEMYLLGRQFKGAEKDQ
ncbi:rRNA methyltransferase 2, mitochondrial [Ixodes scapularis]